MNVENYSKMYQVILGIKKRVFQLFEKEGKTKEELHEFTKKELCKHNIGFPEVSESYKKMVDRLAREKSSQIIPNGTSPYEDLFDFFGLTIN